MAKANGNNSDLMNKLATRVNGNSQVQPAQHTIKSLLSQENVKKRFEEMLGKRAPGFISSIINVTYGNSMLQQADPKTIVSAGVIAAALDLPVDPNLGFAYIVPYNVNKDGKKVIQAQFQMGYKGYIQLAMRTGMYKTINACEVYEGEIKSINRFTGEIEFGEKQSDKIIGYLAYLKLLNGFEKYLYMTVDEIQKHAKTYSKSYNNPRGRWKTDFHAMAIKTVLKRLLSKYGILSIEMQTGLKADQAVINENFEDRDSASYEYPDGVNLDDDAVDVEYQDVPNQAAEEPQQQEAAQA